MKHLTKLFCGILMLGITIAGCKKDKDPGIKSYLQVNDTTVTLTHGTLKYYGADTEGYWFGLGLLTSAITIDAAGYWENSGSVIDFEILSTSENSLSSGIYSYPISDSYYPLFSISESNHCLNWSEAGMNEWNILEICSLTIVNNNNSYIIDFAGIDENGDNVEGHYEGTLEYWDWSIPPKNSVLSDNKPVGR